MRLYADHTWLLRGQYASIHWPYLTITQNNTRLYADHTWLLRRPCDHTWLLRADNTRLYADHTWLLRGQYASIRGPYLTITRTIRVYTWTILYHYADNTRLYADHTWLLRGQYASIYTRSILDYCPRLYADHYLTDYTVRNTVPKWQNLIKYRKYLRLGWHFIKINLKILKIFLKSTQGHSRSNSVNTPDLLETCKNKPKYTKNTLKASSHVRSGQVKRHSQVHVKVISGNYFRGSVRLRSVVFDHVSV